MSAGFASTSASFSAKCFSDSPLTQFIHSFVINESNCHNNSILKHAVDSTHLIRLSLGVFAHFMSRVGSAVV